MAAGNVLYICETPCFFLPGRARAADVSLERNQFPSPPSCSQNSNARGLTFVGFLLHTTFYYSVSFPRYDVIVMATMQDGCFSQRKPLRFGELSSVAKAIQPIRIRTGI